MAGPAEQPCCRSFLMQLVPNQVFDEPSPPESAPTFRDHPERKTFTLGSNLSLTWLISSVPVHNPLAPLSPRSLLVPFDSPRLNPLTAIISQNFCSTQESVHVNALFHSAPEPVQQVVENNLEPQQCRRQRSTQGSDASGFWFKTRSSSGGSAYPAPQRLKNRTLPDISGF